MARANDPMPLRMPFVDKDGVLTVAGIGYLNNLAALQSSSATASEVEAMVPVPIRAGDGLSELLSQRDSLIALGALRREVAELRAIVIDIGATPTAVNALKRRLDELTASVYDEVFAMSGIRRELAELRALITDGHQTAISQRVRNLEAMAALL
jgi:hypothetical protein